MSIAIENLIPHRAPMRWIDALTDCTDLTASATTTFSAKHFAGAGGTVSEMALVECMAQTAAAALGQRARNSGKTGAEGNGMLVAVSNFMIHSCAPVEKLLQIEIRELKRLGPMRMISGVILCDGQAIAAGQLMVYA
jgi:predicted hotdog family 3-hydroxylacyl-ACP dehydratase